MPKTDYILEFSQIDKESIPEAGGKGANLGEMTQNGFPVPPGFVLPSSSYRLFIEENDFKKNIKDILKSTNIKRPSEVSEASEKIRKLLEKGIIPKSIATEAVKRYSKMGGFFKHALVAVRSSATAEDLPDASFAGQQESFLNVQGEASLLEAVRKCWSSLFTPRAIFYREEKKYDHFKVSLAVIVQQMVESEISGIAFTSDPRTSDKHKMVIEAVWGLGELIVQGSLTPDVYEVERHSLEILKIEKQTQDIELVKKGNKNVEKKVPNLRKNKQKLDEKMIKDLSLILQKIHTHYFFPQDIEWAYKNKKFYIIQSRPITTLNQDNISSKEDQKQENTNLILLKGGAASPGIVTGHVKIVQTPKQISKIKKGDILVSIMTSPDFVPAMKLAGGIITDKGGVTSHAAIVSRELGIPCVVGTKDATKKLKDGDVVTVNGKEGIVIRGSRIISSTQVKNETKDIKPRDDIKTATKIYVNLAEPEKAEEAAKLPVSGVGLLRAEFMIAQIGSHPRHLIEQKKHQIFINKLSEGLEVFCRAFDPRPVVYRATDFKTNEYRNLDGGKAFEPEEPNPMLGFRGAFRYVADPEVFELELSCIKKVREKYKNLHVMIPFVRSPQELLEVKRIMAAAGLMRSSTFKLWMMVELPVNVILIEDFINIGIDGVSVGSNDLTMLIEGTDRDNSEVATAFNELSPAILWCLEKVVKACHKAGITSSICGQAASTYDSLVQELVHLGITSVSVNPDAIGRTQKMIYDIERRVGR